MKMTCVFQKVPEGYIAFIEEIPGVNIQSSTLEEAKEDLKLALEDVLAVNREIAEESLLSARSPFFREAMVF
jgi:predicted RNase H-like HicB family nuclease